MGNLMNLFDWNFNFFYSIQYWVAFLAIALVAHGLNLSPKWRGLFMGLASSFMLLAIPQFGLQDLGLVLTLSLLTYFLGAVLMRSDSCIGTIWRRLIAWAGIITVLSFLAFFKYRFVQNFLLPGQVPDDGVALNVVRLIGVSYFSFRMIHFLVESYRKKVESLNLLNCINFIIFFPSFISGPINRYNHFTDRFNSNPGSRRATNLRMGGERIVHGLFKKFVLAQILYPHILSTQPDVLVGLKPLEAILALYAYAFYFYFDFAGYTDLALGCARLIGVELPENFNNPFLKRNIRELWANWHMSLTSWLVDYIYWPIVRKFRSFDFFRRHPIFLSNLGMTITFIACGMWHGETANFILWGAYHGIGISVLTVYQREKRKTKSPFLMRYFRSRVSAALGIFLTFNYFAFGLSFFVLDLARFRILANAILSKF